jgi:ferritin
MKTIDFQKNSTALNEQMTKEAHASQIYLSYAALITMDLLVSNFLFAMQEERNHMMKILEYILNRGAKPKSVLFLHPQLTLSVNNCFEKYLSTK